MDVNDVAREGVTGMRSRSLIFLDDVAYYPQGWRCDVIVSKTRILCRVVAINPHGVLVRAETASRLKRIVAARERPMELEITDDQTRSGPVDCQVVYMKLGDVFLAFDRAAGGKSDLGGWHLRRVAQG